MTESIPKCDFEIIDDQTPETNMLDCRIKQHGLLPVKQTINFETLSEESDYVITIHYKKHSNLRSTGNPGLLNLKSFLGVKPQSPKNVFGPGQGFVGRNVCAIQGGYLANIQNGLRSYISGLKWASNMIIAGEYIFCQVSPWSCEYECRCIDIFIYGDRTEETVRTLLAHFSNFNAYYLIDENQYIRIIIPEFLHDIRIIQAPEYKTPLEVVSNINLGCYQMYYDGQDVWITEQALYDLVHRTCTFNPIRTQINKISLYKTLRRGLSISLNKLVWECFEYCRTHPDDISKIYTKRDDSSPVNVVLEEGKYTLDIKALSNSFHEMMKNELTKMFLVRKLHEHAIGANLIPAIKGYYEPDKVFCNDFKPVLEIMSKLRIKQEQQQEKLKKIEELNTLQDFLKEQNDDFIRQLKQLQAEKEKIESKTLIKPETISQLVPYTPQYQRNLDDVSGLQMPLTSSEKEFNTSSVLIIECGFPCERGARVKAVHYNINMKNLESIPYIDILIGPGYVTKLTKFFRLETMKFQLISCNLTNKLNEFTQKISRILNCSVLGYWSTTVGIGITDPKVLDQLDILQSNKTPIKLWCKLRVWNNKSNDIQGISLELSSITE